MPLRITRSVPEPSSRTNCSSFLLLGTALQALILTARKSDLEKVSKSTMSSNRGSISTWEKSMGSAAAGAGAASAAGASGWAGAASGAFSGRGAAGPSRGFMVGNSSTSRMEAESVSSMTSRSTPKPRPPVGGRPYSRALT